ncbi:MAG: hypothetical protein H7837_04770 [Magnetococcus sp. MYC-9]
MDDWEEPDLDEALDATAAVMQQAVAPVLWKNQAEVESWLQVGLEQYLFEEMGAWSFPGAVAEFARWETPAEALQAFCGRLRAENRAWFRQSVANLAASLPPDSRNILLFEHLLEIAVAVGASEMLRVLPDRIGRGFFGQIPDLSGQRRLFATSLLMAARLSAPRKEARVCLETLIDAQPFRETGFAYAGIALVSLCRADPDGWLQHLDRLRGPLHRMFQHYETDDAAKRRLGQEVLEVVTLPKVADSLLELVCFEPPGSSPADDWLLQALVVGDDPPLELVEDRDGVLKIRRRDGGGFFSCILLENISNRGVHTLGMVRMNSWIQREEASGLDAVGAWQQFLRNLGGQSEEIGQFFGMLDARETCHA